MDNRIKSKIKTYGSTHKKKLWLYRGLSIVAAFAVFCTTYVLILPAITIGNDPICGLEDHTHTAECFDSEQQVLVCALTEHTHHEIFCYVEEKADMETCDMWEKTLPQELSKDWSSDVVSVALSQLGYTESEINVQVGATGKVSGYSRYGDWYGKPYAQWNHIFVSFCLFYAGVSEDYIPQKANIEEFIDIVSKTELLKEGYEGAEPGDILITVDKNGTLLSGILCDFEENITLGTIPIMICGDVKGVVEKITVDPESNINYVSVRDAYEAFSQDILVDLPDNKQETSITVSGQDYTVTVTFDETAGIPENAQLIVKEIIGEDAADYLTQVQNANNQKSDIKVIGSCARFFDIGFYLDGKEIEPVEGSDVRVDITFTDNFNLTKSETLDVFHFYDDGHIDIVDNIKANKISQGNSSSSNSEKSDNAINVTFKTNSFSVFGVAAAEEYPISTAASGQYPLNPAVFWMYTRQKDSSFYWRFREQDENGNWLSYPGADGVGSSSEDQSNLTENGEPIVTVTYENSDNDSGSIPYFSYQQSLNSSNYKKMLPLDEFLAADGKYFIDGSNWTKIKIETAEGYVVTRYSINCEWGSSDGSSIVGNGYSPNVPLPNNKAENCQTAITNDNSVDVDATGQYRSSFYVDGHDNIRNSTDNPTLSDSITETDCGHLSWGIAGSNYRYVLLIEVAKINFEIDIEKKAEPEMVTTGDSITYTAVADFPSSKATENISSLNNVVFTDEFFKNSTITSVKYISKSGTVYNLSSSSSATAGSNGVPTSYYLNKTEGKIYINSNGQWEKDDHFEITYKYKTSSNISNTQVLTNTIFVSGTFSGATRKAYAVANVEVIVNSTPKGSIRIYKTFKGLTNDEVFDIVLNSNYKLQLLQNGSPMSMSIMGENNVTKQVTELTVDNKGLKFYSSDDNSVTYYADILNLSQGSSYSVAEFNYLYGDYLWSGSYSVNNGEEKDLLSGGKTGVFSVITGSSTQIDIKNVYSNKINIIIRKVGQLGEPLGDASFLLQVNNSGVWTDVSEFSVEVVDGVSQYTINELDSGTYKLTETRAPPGYYPLTQSVTFVIDSGKLTLSDKETDNVILTEENGISVITVRNTTGYELPQTGGVGIIPYTLGGLLVVGAAASLFVYRNRGRKQE